METTNKIEVNYTHPTPGTDREAEIIARIDYLDAKKKVAVIDKDDAAVATIQAELDSLCAEWDAGRKTD